MANKKRAKHFFFREAAQQRRLHPKLRMILDGDAEVNSVRSAQCAFLSVDGAKAPAPPKDPSLVSFDELQKGVKHPGRLQAIARGVAANVILHLKRSAAENAQKDDHGKRGRLRTETVKLTEIDELLANKDVIYIEPGEALKAPRPVVAGGARKPASGLRKIAQTTHHKDGANVLVGIIDVQGFDFAHEDFLDAGGKTRFAAIWDQGGSLRDQPRGFDYGAEITKAHMDKALADARTAGAPATELEPQSSMEHSSHGTHVTSIAAGNHGVARKATIAAVLLSLGKGEWDRRRSFYDSTRISHAVEYLLGLGERLKMPVSINISLGTNGSAHDGCGGVSRWIDHALTQPGRAVCVATGNAGQESGESADDMGYIMGRIHTSGRINGPNLTRDITWNVVGNGVVDASENELEIWYQPQDAFAVSIKPPGGEWIGPVEPRRYIENRQLGDGSFLSVYNELYHPVNGANYIAIYLSPYLSRTAVVGVTAGTWTVRLHGREVRDGSYHGWIERDDPQELQEVDGKAVWNFPSFFTEPSNVDDSSISSLACGQRTIAVANLDAVREVINISSSEGPTRDGRSKPDVAAPGTDIVAANGFSSGDDAWVSMTGTSMASPYACGVAALMLATEPDLTAAQIEAIMRRTAAPLPGHTYAWRKDAGFGRLDPDACVREAASIHHKTELEP